MRHINTWNPNIFTGLMASPIILAAGNFLSFARHGNYNLAVDRCRSRISDDCLSNLPLRQMVPKRLLLNPLQTTEMLHRDHCSYYCQLLLVYSRLFHMYGCHFTSVS